MTNTNKSKFTLFIDTTSFDAVTYALKSGDKVAKKSYKIDHHQSHETLAKLEEFLKSGKIKQRAIKKIIVNKGPGSFTGTRVGAAHALALGLAWEVPVEGLENKKFLKHLGKI